MEALLAIFSKPLAAGNGTRLKSIPKTTSRVRAVVRVGPRTSNRAVAQNSLDILESCA
jgi:hypothetical protein